LRKKHLWKTFFEKIYFLRQKRLSSGAEKLCSDR
jgi:hypothetical protein